MKIVDIVIKKFRSLNNINIRPKNILALVGCNNSGKSNVIKALELYFENSKKLIKEESFYNHNENIPIEIIITFKEINKWEKTKLEAWMYDSDTIKIGKLFYKKEDEEYEISQYAIVKVPEPEWLQEEFINGSKISEWWQIKDKLKINDLDFGLSLGSRRPNVGEWKEIAKQFVIENAQEIPWLEKILKNPRGLSNVLKGTLPEFIHIPAVKDITDEAKVVKTNPFGKLINSMLDKIPDQKKALIKTKIIEVEKLLNRMGESQRIDGISSLEKRLTKLINEIMDCDVEIEMPMPKLHEVFSTAKIYIDDGVRTVVESKGHGLQRSAIFSILRAYAELINSTDNEDTIERSIYFAIEEPELYLHPLAQKTLMGVFRTITREKDQIFYSTHSSLFVDVIYFDEICIMRREKKNESYESITKQLTMEELLEDLKARHNKEGTKEGIREQHKKGFTSSVNEGFFGDKVVIVEGPSEENSLPIFAECFGYNFNKNNIAIVHIHGKGQIDRIYRIFNGFEIPTYIIFDGDKNTKESDNKKKTLEILQLLGEEIKELDKIETEVKDKFTIFETTYDDILKNEIQGYENMIGEATRTLGPIGKPLKCKWVANKCKEKIINGESIDTTVPKIIIDMIEKIKNVSFSESILKINN